MTITRSHIRKSLQDKGFTYREARDIVSVLFDVLVEELKKTGKLELPFGSFTMHEPTPKRLYRLGKIVTVYKGPRIHFRKKD